MSLHVFNVLRYSSEEEEEEEENAEAMAGPRLVDQHGFMVAGAGSPVMPAWEVNHTKQLQRLTKWRSMLGECPEWRCSISH